MHQELYHSTGGSWNFSGNGGDMRFLPNGASKKKRKLSYSDEDEDEDEDENEELFGNNHINFPDPYEKFYEIPLVTDDSLVLIPTPTQQSPLHSPLIQKKHQDTKYPIPATEAQHHHQLSLISLQHSPTRAYSMPHLPTVDEEFEIPIGSVEFSPPVESVQLLVHRKRYKTFGGIITFLLFVIVISVMSIDYHTELGVFEQYNIQIRNTPIRERENNLHENDIPLEGNPQYEESRNSRLEVREKKMLIYDRPTTTTVRNTFPIRLPYSIFTYNEELSITWPNTGTLMTVEGLNIETDREYDQYDDDCKITNIVHSSYRFELLPYTFTNQWALYPNDVNSDGIPRLRVKDLLEFKVCCWTTVGEFQCSSNGGNDSNSSNRNNSDTTTKKTLRNHTPGSLSSYPFFATIVQNHESGANFVKIKFTDETLSSKRCVLSFVSEVCM